MRVIYDLGSNNGDDLPYYLKKADKVVAVEANPALSDQIRRRFPREIADGHLIVEGCVLTRGSASAEVYFYIHKGNHVQSQFPEPSPLDSERFEKVLLPSRPVVDVLAQHGAPYYVKIDVEHYDEQILYALFENDIRPPFLSAEAHSLRVFGALASLGGYDAFKLVEGSSVAERYRNYPIATRFGPEIYSFPHHSAGPFGEDLDGSWMTASNFLRRFAIEGPGWKDIHVTNQIPADPAAHVRLRDFAVHSIRRRLARIL